MDDDFDHLGASDTLHGHDSVFGKADASEGTFADDLVEPTRNVEKVMERNSF